MTKKSKNAPTSEQIDEFYKYVFEYQTLLNLQDWRIEPSTRKASKGAMADVSISYGDKLAVVALGRDWGKPILDEDLRSTALHEILHIFLRPLIEASRTRDDMLVDSAEHSVVVLLEKLLA